MIATLEETFRPTFGRVMAGAVIGLCAFAAIGVGLEGFGPISDVWPWLGLVGVGSWACYWNPRVFVTDAGIQVVNPLRTFDVPWPAVIDIETKWALTILTARGNVRAWAAPSPGRQVLRGQRSEERRMPGMPKNSAARPSDLASTESGAAAHIVRQRWLRLIDTGNINLPAYREAPEGVRWHVGVIALLIVFALWAIASVVW